MLCLIYGELGAQRNKPVRILPKILTQWFQVKYGNKWNCFTCFLKTLHKWHFSATCYSCLALVQVHSFLFIVFNVWIYPNLFIYSPFFTELILYPHFVFSSPCVLSLLSPIQVQLNFNRQLYIIPTLFRNLGPSLHWEWKDSIGSYCNNAGERRDANRKNSMEKRLNRWTLGYDTLRDIHVLQ